MPRRSIARDALAHALLEASLKVLLFTLAPVAIATRLEVAHGLGPSGRAGDLSALLLLAMLGMPKLAGMLGVASFVLRPSRQAAGMVLAVVATFFVLGFAYH